MKIKKFFIMTLILVGLILNYKISYAYKNTDLFNDITNEVNGETVEYGIKNSFKSNKNGQEACKYFLNILNKESIKCKLIRLKQKDDFCIEFESKNSKGYIQCDDINGKCNVSLQIVEQGDKNRLSNLKDKFKILTVSMEKEEQRQFQYLKIKIPNDKTEEINDKIKSLLKKQGAENLDSIKINNGFSVTAYTHKYNKIKNQGKFIDFNYALCKYPSGNYIIIGTPEIFVSY